MASSRGSSDSNANLFLLLGIFVFLFIAAGTLAVFLFVKVEDSRKLAAQAESELRKYATSSELRDVSSLVGKGKKTVLGQLDEDTKYLCGLIAGEDLEAYSLAQARALVDERLKPIWETLQISLTNPEEGKPSAGLANIAETLIRERDQYGQLLVQVEEETAQQKLELNQTISQQTALIEQLQKDLAQASLAAKSNELAYQKRIDQQRQGYEDLIASDAQKRQLLEEENESFYKQNQRLGETINKYEKKMQEMEVIVQHVRQDIAPDVLSAALTPDGYVVQVTPRDKLAYINLGKSDHIYRGLTFTVYDSYQSGSKEGKGKIEVIEILDTVSKCRITEWDPTNPIMQKDVIANLLWDKDKKYQFCVAGGFDYNGDDAVDPDGLENIVKLIRNWGGQVSDSVSVDTDFLVLGRPPVVPVRPSDEDMERRTPKAMAYQRQFQAAQAYDVIRSDALGLGVPTFNPSRFFDFIGYHPGALIR